jgi:hypothetical protein
MCEVDGVKYRFVKPYYLQKEGCLKLIKATVVGSSLRWNIGDGYLTYNKLRNENKKGRA